MVKKIKRFIVFVLFSMVFQLIHNKVQTGENDQNLKLIPSAEAKCCPQEADHVDSNGNCCTTKQSCTDKNGNCCDCDNCY